MKWSFVAKGCYFSQHYGHCKNLASGPFIVFVSVFMVQDELYSMEQLKDKRINTLTIVCFFLDGGDGYFYIPSLYKCSALLHFMQRVDYCYIFTHLVSGEAASLGLFALATFSISTKFSYDHFPPSLKNHHVPKSQQKGPTQVCCIRNRWDFPTFWCEKTHAVHFCVPAKPTCGKNAASSED